MYKSLAASKAGSCPGRGFHLKCMPPQGGCGLIARNAACQPHARRAPAARPGAPTLSDPPPPLSLSAALLFGQLIHHSLVSSISLGIALRYVLEALRTPGGSGSKMARFGATALKQFAGDLAQWPQYCQHLAQVEWGGVGGVGG